MADVPTSILPPEEFPILHTWYVEQVCAIAEVAVQQVFESVAYYPIVLQTVRNLIPTYNIAVDMLWDMLQYGCVCCAIRWDPDTFNTPTLLHTTTAPIPTITSQAILYDDWVTYMDTLQLTYKDLCMQLCSLSGPDVTTLSSASQQLVSWVQTKATSDDYMFTQFYNRLSSALAGSVTHACASYITNLPTDDMFSIVE
jgi:hypothetical protein